MRGSEHPERDRREALRKIQDPQQLVPRDISFVEILLFVAFIVAVLLFFHGLKLAI